MPSHTHGTSLRIGTLSQSTVFASLFARNFSHALRQARLHYHHDHIWIDAVFINQLDLDGEPAQVAMMGGLYAKAARVLAYIGPSDAFFQNAHELHGVKRII